MSEQHQFTFDLAGGREARDEGMRRVGENSGRWKADAMRAIRMLPHGWRGLAEDIRFAIRPATGEPHHTNAYGELIKEAAKHGLLRKTGKLSPMKLRESHARLTPEWERI